MRRKIIIGNWKMNRDRRETIDFLMTLNHMVNKNHLLTDSLDVAIAPSFLSLIAAKTYISRGGLFTKNSLKKLIVCAQDAYSEVSGSYTGAVSFSQLKEEGIMYSLVGHYETRKMNHLTDEDINKKVLSLTNNGMNSILCIGDNLEDKEANRSSEVILEQLEKALKGVLIDNLDHLIVAYEPIYAIGTSNPVPVDEIVVIFKKIREKLSQLYSKDASELIRIIYGGSINSANYAEYMNEDEIDGLLIGKTSLDVTAFYDIMYGTSEIITNKYPPLGNNYYILKKKEISNIAVPLPTRKIDVNSEQNKEEKKSEQETVSEDISDIKKIQENEVNKVENESKEEINS